MSSMTSSCTDEASKKHGMPRCGAWWDILILTFSPKSSGLINFVKKKILVFGQSIQQLMS